jgi:hypothetical protein
MNVEKAIEFVRTNGNKFEQSRLNNIIGMNFDRTEVLKAFSNFQNPDGGFPFGDRNGFPSCLSNTAMAFHNLLEMDLDDSAVAKRCVKFFLKMKTDKGTWPENNKIKPLDPPFWDMPGDDMTTLWLTADISDLILRTGVPVSKKTAQYIKKHQEPEGRFTGYIHTTWMALSIFGKNGFGNEKIYSRALTFLEKIDIEDWDASCVAWCLDSMKRGDVDNDSTLWNKLLGQLSATQEPDGSWPSDEGDHLKARDANSVLVAALDIIEK